MNKSFLKKDSIFLKFSIVTLGIAILLLFLISSIRIVPSNKEIGLAYQRVIVQEGDTIWGLVKRINNQENTYIIIEETIKLNNLNNTYLQPGQVIYIPLDL